MHTDASHVMIVLHLRAELGAAAESGTQHLVRRRVLLESLRFEQRILFVVGGIGTGRQKFRRADCDLMLQLLAVCSKHLVLLLIVCHHAAGCCLILSIVARCGSETKQVVNVGSGSTSKNSLTEDTVIDLEAQQAIGSLLARANYV